MTPSKQRKAAERARMKSLGLVRVEVYVHPHNREKVRKYAERLTHKVQFYFERASA